MKNFSMSLPRQQNYQYAYDFAYKLAGEQLAEIKDLEQQCRRSGAEYKVIDTQKVIFVEYLNQKYRVTVPDIEISPVSGGKLPIKEKILILHYLTQASGIPLSHKMIAFQELPEGASYLPTFAKRSIEPLVKYFGEQPQRLIKAAEGSGGHKADYGDVAVTVSGFKQVPVTLVLWRGDEEFPPRGTILFDATIANYLATYDITVLCENIAWKLVRALKERGA